MTQAQTKINIGWISFACCEDSTIMFAELLNDYFFEFKQHFNFVDAPVLSSKRDQESPLDIVFIEGACISPQNATDMKKLRDRSKKVVSIGSCACTGMPSAHRNSFTSEQLAEIEHVLERFDYADKVEPVSAIIPVDALVPGCPMDLNVFMTAVNGLLEEFGHSPIAIKSDQNKIDFIT